MTDVPGTSPERPIIWSPGRPATVSRRRPVDVLIQNFCIFLFPVRDSNRCVKQELLHLENTFFIKLSIFCWSPKSPLKVPWSFRTFRGPSGDVPGRRVPAGSSLLYPSASLHNILKYRMSDLSVNSFSAITNFAFTGCNESFIKLSNRNAAFKTKKVRCYQILDRHLIELMSYM